MSMLKKLAAAAVLASACATSAHAVTIVGPTFTFQGHSYTELSSDNWTNSEAFTSSHGGHLVAVNSADENNFITTTFGQSHALWIGMYRTGANSFGWSNGDAVTYTNWQWGEPNNSGGDENYVHTYTSGTWNDLSDNNGYAGAKFGVMEVAAVPEPETYAMMLAGLGLMGLFARRRAAK